MEEAARIISKAFSSCVTDRCSSSTRHPRSTTDKLGYRTSPYAESRKWGVYYVVGLILKCYFRVCGTARPSLAIADHSLTTQVKRISLSKNILRAIDANPDIPPLSAYPRSHQVSNMCMCALAGNPCRPGNISILYWHAEFLE